MSYGVVACSKCRREVHQNGPVVHHSSCKTPTRCYCPHGWTHCEDLSARCEGAESSYIGHLKGEPVGRFCSIDRGPDERPV